MITTLQLLTAGVSEQAIRRAVRAGVLHRLYRGVYTPVDPALLGQRGRWMAAVLACGEGSALSHLAAAANWKMLTYGGTLIDVTVPARSGRALRRNIRIHRSSNLPGQTTRRHNIPTTKPARTTLDLGEALGEREYQRAADEAAFRGLVDEAALRAVLNANPGHHGAGALAAVLGRHELGSTGRPRVNEMVLGYEVDFHWPDARLIVETDGWAAHGRRTAFEEDRVRDARLTVAGWRVVRFTRYRIVWWREEVGDQLEALLQPERRSISSTL